MHQRLEKALRIDLSELSHLRAPLGAADFLEVWLKPTEVGQSQESFKADVRGALLVIARVYGVDL